MNRKIWFFQITGWISIVGSITLFSLIGTDILLSGEFFNRTIYYVLASVLGAGGISLISWAVIIYRKYKTKKENIDIFEILSKYSGQITPSEFSVESGLDPEESKVKLDDMYKNGICRIHVTESGVLIYYFPDFEHEGIVRKPVSENFMSKN
ncbi:MAG: hypothetical protein AB7E04_09655 [Desulfobacteraceae bacterium]|jgi:hypothetical protein